MIEFLEIVTSFPTVVYTVLLLVVMAHWLLSALGILEIDTIDGLMPDGFGGHHVGGPDPGGHLSAGHGHAVGVDHPGHHHEAESGLLMKFGLHGVPVMVIFTIIAIVGWSFCFFVDQYLLRGSALGWLTLPAEIATLIGGVVVSIPIARIVLAPVRRLMRKLAPAPQRPMLGRHGTVRSPEVTAISGTAEVDDGGAGLILQVRVDDGVRFVRGDHVVLIEYLESQNAYRVISGEEFGRL